MPSCFASWFLGGVRSLGNKSSTIPTISTLCATMVGGTPPASIFAAARASLTENGLAQSRGSESRADTAPTSPAAISAFSEDDAVVLCLDKTDPLHDRHFALAMFNSCGNDKPREKP